MVSTSLSRKAVEALLQSAKTWDPFDDQIKCAEWIADADASLVENAKRLAEAADQLLLAGGAGPHA